MARNIRDDVEKFFDYDINLQTRTLYMGSNGVEEDGESGVNYLMAERVIKGLHILDMQAPQNDKPITIVMNNIGGDYYHGMAIYDAIKACHNHITIQVFGHAMSMGIVILQAADERQVAPHSKMMLHYGETGFHGHSKNMKRWAEEEERINREMEIILLEKMVVKNPKMDKEKLRKLLQFDTFLSAEEAIELGLADKVIDNE
jgi:ATP-dependent Clp protease protease subunit